MQSLINISSKKIFSFFTALSVLSLFLLFGQTTKAAEEREEHSYSIDAFLDEMEMTFSEYLETVASLERAGIIPYKLSENNVRYFDFMRRNPDVSESTAIAYVNARVGVPFYTNIERVTEPYSITLLVNKHYALAQEWIAEDMVSLNYGYRLREEAAEQFNLMTEAMAEDGLNLRVASAYRSYYTQERLYRNSRNSYGETYADGGLARAGHSEHQTGSPSMSAR